MNFPLPIAVSVSLLMLGSAAFGQAQIPWEPSVESAFRRAAGEGKLILIHFYADDCAPCRTMDHYVFTRGEVARAIDQDYVPVKVNAKDEPRLAQQYDVTSWPTDLIVTPDGARVGQFISKQNAAEYISLLGRVAESARMNAGRLAGRSPADRETWPPRNVTDPPQDRSYADQAYADHATYYGDSANYPANSNAAETVDPARGYSDPFAGRPGTEPRTTGRQNAPGGYGGDFQPRPNQEGGYGYRVGASQESGQYQGGDFQDPRGGYQPGTTGGRPEARGGAYPESVDWPPRQESLGGGLGPQSQPIDDFSTQDRFESSAAERGRESAGGNPWGQNRPQGNPYARQAAIAPPATAGPPQGNPHAGGDAGQTPPVALDGYCPVTLVERETWQKADLRWGAVHRGRLYLFTGPQEQRMFLENPDYYSPALSGFDPVAYVETGNLVDGQRKFGVFVGQQVYLFSSEDNVRQFEAAQQPYVEAVHHAMSRADARVRR